MLRVFVYLPNLQYLWGQMCFVGLSVSLINLVISLQCLYGYIYVCMFVEQGIIGTLGL